MESNFFNIAASYQEAILDCLFISISNAILEYPDVKNIYISGGVAANQRLREKSQKIESKSNIKIILPKLEYCTDNAAMIGMAAYHKIINGQFLSDA